jgi:molecular chaperone DnaJ
VPLTRIATGGEEEVRYTRATTCSACKRTGAKDGTKIRRCQACNGTGNKAQESRRRERSGEVIVRNITICPECRGRGEIIEELCPVCRGEGTVEQEDSLTVDVPVGAEDGMALRVPGHGLPSEAAGGAPGDLFVIIRTARDSRFERRGADLWRSETVSVPEAVLGTKRTVPSLDGSVEMSIPPATQPGLVLRIAGKGLPEFGGSGRGDLYVRVDVQIPDRLDKRQRELYEELRSLEPT